MKYAMTSTRHRRVVATSILALTVLSTVGDLAVHEPIVDALEGLARNAKPEPFGGLVLMGAIAACQLGATILVCWFLWSGMERSLQAIGAWWATAVAGAVLYGPTISGSIESVAPLLLCGVMGFVAAETVQAGDEGTT